MIDNVKFLETAINLKTIKDKIKYLQNEEKKTVKKLQDLCGGETYAHECYTFERIERVGSVKYKDIPELEEVNLALYRGENVIAWKLNYIPKFDI